MGPSQSQQKGTPSGQNNDQENLTIKHPKFNNLKVISPPSDEDEGIIEIIIPLPNETEFKRWEKKVKEIGEFENIFLPISQKFEKTEFCGSGGISTIQYKYYPYLLSDEIVNRFTMENKYFEEAELWYLIYSIISAASTFHTKNLKLGDIRPQNIFISPEGQVRVSTQYSWPGEQTNYQKTVFEKEVTYLSPEELKDIGYGKLEESPNFNLSESFSVGLTCLDAATLSDSSKLYIENNKLNYNSLEERLVSLEKNNAYSEPLILIIKGLCQVDSEKRANCIDLAQWLSKYEDSIIELQDFNVQELPDRLSSLRVQKPRDSRSANPPPGYQYQTESLTVNPPPANYISQQPGKVSSKPQSLPQQYILPPAYQPGPQGATYVSTVPMVQSHYGGEYQNSYSQASNNNPSIITFQRETNPRSNIMENPVNPSQLRTNINLQQIDEQLQMSRKLFPS